MDSVNHSSHRLARGWVITAGFVRRTTLPAEVKYAKDWMEDALRDRRSSIVKLAGRSGECPHPPKLQAAVTSPQTRKASLPKVRGVF